MPGLCVTHVHVHWYIAHQVRSRNTTVHFSTADWRSYDGRRGHVAIYWNTIAGGYFGNLLVKQQNLGFLFFRLWSQPLYSTNGLVPGGAYLTHLHLADGAAPGVAFQKRGLLEPWDFGANQKWFVILTFCHVMAILTSVSKAFKSLQWARVEGWQCVYCRPFFQSWGG